LAPPSTPFDVKPRAARELERRSRLGYHELGRVSRAAAAAAGLAPWGKRA